MYGYENGIYTLFGHYAEQQDCHQLQLLPVASSGGGAAAAAGWSNAGYTVTIRLLHLGLWLAFHVDGKWEAGRGLALVPTGWSRWCPTTSSPSNRGKLLELI